MAYSGFKLFDCWLEWIDQVLKQNWLWQLYYITEQHVFEARNLHSFKSGQGRLRDNL